MSRKVIKIRAEDSPNVRRAQMQIAAGLEPDNLVLYPGVLTWEEYRYRRKTWDVQRQCVGLDAEFYEGAQQFLFPRERLEQCIRLAAEYVSGARKRVYGPTFWMGVDPAEGGDRSAWVVMDRLGIVELESVRTPNTNFIPRKTVELMDKWRIEPNNVCMDRGSGKQHADRLAEWGRPIRTVAFGESISTPIKTGMTPIIERVEIKEDQSIYRNRRTEMYWEAALLLDFEVNPEGFALPPAIANWHEEGRKSLFDQLRIIPREYDKDGRPYLRPKNIQPGQGEAGKRLKSLVELVGHSPDESDAWVLACHAMTHRRRSMTAGAVGR